MYGTYPTENTILKDTYIVWSPSASQPPKMVYPDRPTAIKAAYAMASKFPSQRFTVCKVVGEAKSVKVEFTSFED